MDKKVYLKSLEGSPYIDEGLWNNLKKYGKKYGSAAINKFKGITPHTSFTTPKEQPSTPGEAPEPVIRSPQATGQSHPESTTTATTTATTNPSQQLSPTPTPSSSISGNKQQFSTQSELLDMNVLLMTINLIYNRIKNDPWSDEDPHKYMSKSIDSWRSQDPKKIPKATYNPSGSDIASINEDEDEDKKENDIHFLRRFRQYYRKYTGSFTQQVGVFSYKKRTYEILWHSFGSGEKGHGHNNEILAKIYDQNNPTQKSTVIRLFSFWDHQIDPRYPSSERFSIPDLFKQANPSVKSPFTKEEEARLKDLNLQEKFHKALFAVTDRKTLELKHSLTQNQSDAVDSLMGNDWEEDVATTYVEMAGVIIGKNADPEFLKDKAKELKLKSGTDQSQAMKSVEYDLVKLGKSAVPPTTPEDAKKYVKMAVDKIGPNAGESDIYSAANNFLQASKFQALKTTKPEVEVPGKKNPIENKLEKINKGLESLGVEKLDNVYQVKKLISLHGNHNAKVSKKTISISGEKSQEIFQSKNLLKGFKPEQKEIWQKLVTMAKQPTSESKISRRFINPFVSSNFV